MIWHIAVECLPDHKKNIHVHVCINQGKIGANIN